MKIVEKLSTYAALIGVIGAIGGGFYTWGQFNLRLDQIENKKFVVNETVDLTPIRKTISTLKVELIDRVSKVEDKIKPQDMTWVVEAHIAIRESVAKVREEIAMLDIPTATNLNPLNKLIKELEDKVSELKQQVAIVSKENELQDILMEEIKAKNSNPLGG
jgi:hypothetical protein